MITDYINAFIRYFISLDTNLLLMKDK